MSEWFWKQKPIWKQFCARLTLQHDPARKRLCSREWVLASTCVTKCPICRRTSCQTWSGMRSFGRIPQLVKPFNQMLLFTIVIFRFFFSLTSHLARSYFFTIVSICFFENLQTKVLSACFPLWIHDGCGHVESSAFRAMMRLSLAGAIVWLHAFSRMVVGTETFANFCFAQIHAVAETDSLADPSDGPSPGG